MRLAIMTAVSVAALSTAAFAATQQAVLPPAPPAGAGLPSGQCIRSHDIKNHTVVDSRTLLIDVNRQTYRLTMSGACLAGATSSDPIITRQPPGQALICKPIDIDISISKGGFTTPCIVSSIDKLTPEQVAALPRRLKP
jgi:hypothetical protein